MRVIKNGLEVEITCPHCKSILAYNKNGDVIGESRAMTGPVMCDDGVVRFGSYTDFALMIECPCCKQRVRVG